MINDFVLPDQLLKQLLCLSPTWEKSQVFSRTRNERGLIKPQTRSSLSAKIDEEDQFALREFLLKALKPKIENTYGVPLGNLTPIHLIRYEKGHFFLPHRDRGGPNAKATFTVIGFLRQPTEGGQLVILEPEKEVVEPISGKVVVFPSDVLHEGAEVKSGSKEIFVGWFNEP